MFDAIDRQLGHEALNRGEDRVVAAARAPPDVLIRLEVLLCQLDFYAVTVALSVAVRHEISPRWCSRVASSSAALNGTPATLVVAAGINQELGAHELEELSEIVLRDHHALVAAEHLAEIQREWIEMPQLRVRDRFALFSQTPARGLDRSERGSPAQDEKFRVTRWVVDFDSWDVLRDAGNLLRAQQGHAMVVLRLVIDVAFPVGLLETADAVLQTRRTRDRPRSRESFGIAKEWPELAVRIGFGRKGKGRREVWKRRSVRDFPGLRSRSQECVREHDHRSAVFESDARCLEHHVEAIRRRRRSHYRKGSFPMAAEHRVQEVALFGLGRHARRWSCALDVEDEQRKLHRDGETDRLRLEVQSGSRRNRYAETPGERSAQGGARRSDLVLTLHRLDAEGLVLRKVLKHVRGRRDRIARENQLQARTHARRDQAERDRGVARDVAVYAGLKRRRLDHEAMGEHLRRLAERDTGAESLEVGFGDGRVLAELCLDPAFAAVGGTREHPRQQTQGEHVAWTAGAPCC